MFVTATVTVPSGVNAGSQLFDPVEVGLNMGATVVFVTGVVCGAEVQNKSVLLTVAA
jgi:hypothetical protein